LIGSTWAGELEGTGIRVLNVDPGDLQTDMHQAAFPGEDISDRSLPSDSAAALIKLLKREPASGRYALLRDEA